MSNSTPTLSLIIPTLNEEKTIAETLVSLQAARAAGVQIIVVDGGSKDETQAVAEPLVDLLTVAPSGRASQMNHGASLATGDGLLFLHADTTLPIGFIQKIEEWQCSAKDWGFFRVKLSGSAWQFRVIEWFMNRRSGFTRVATGDQALFIRRVVFQSAGGFAEIPLMEDVELSSRMRKYKGAPHIITTPVTTDSRRWETRGIWRTVWLMWRLRFAYWLGADPKDLASRYR